MQTRLAQTAETTPRERERFWPLRHCLLPAPCSARASLARVSTPKHMEVQIPNSKMPDSQRGADLRAEPLVLTRAHSKF